MTSFTKDFLSAHDLFNKNFNGQNIQEIEMQIKNHPHIQRQLATMRTTEDAKSAVYI